MKLYVEQKVFSWTDRFYVKGENEQDKYYVEGELFSFGKKLHVYNIAGMEVAYIQQKVMSVLPRYRIIQNGQIMAEIEKEFTFFKPRYCISGPNWEIEGDFWAHDYQITCNGIPIVTIAKAWFFWGDCYVLDIQNPEDEILALAAVLTIDCVLDNDNNG